MTRLGFHMGWDLYRCAMMHDCFRNIRSCLGLTPQQRVGFAFTCLGGLGREEAYNLVCQFMIQ
jgi:hypothetical protein